jgi:hypothetical protein
LAEEFNSIVNELPFFLSNGFKKFWLSSNGVNPSFILKKSKPIEEMTDIGLKLVSF